MEKEQQLQINLAPELAGGTYSNMAIISHSNAEFLIDFVSMLPGMKQGNVRSRVIMTPENAKKVLFALQDNIQKYENQYGAIKITGTPAPGSTLPMSFGGGEA